VVGDHEVCEPCVRLAVRIAVDMAGTFGGTIIDASRPCGNVKPDASSGRQEG
jgi:hypothetical protein